MHDLPVKNIPTKALVVESQGAAFELKSVILDEVRENEVLIEMKYTGVCHTVSKVSRDVVTLPQYALQS